MMRQQRRTFEQIEEQYQIEKQLAEKLRDSTQQERQELYNSVYDELFKRFPYLRESSPRQIAKRVASEMRYLRPFLRGDIDFLEIGAGNCALSFEIAKLVNTVYAIDVSNKITQNLTPPLNFTLILSNGCIIPLPMNSIAVVYSNQLMEHLHPDDVLEQLRSVYKVLIPGGVYICITPNRLSGPHDISKHFDTIATGLHLKEYTVKELSHLFKEVGFSQVRIFVLIRRTRFFLPMFPVELCERFLSALPDSMREPIASNRIVSKLLGINMVAEK